MLILPAIDLRGGKCVRLRQGDYADETVYSDDPIEISKSFANEGASWIHVVDLDGAKAGVPQNLEIAERIAKESGAKVEFGGGVRDLHSANVVLRAGITRVIFGSSLVKNELRVGDIFQELGDQAVAGIDARNGKVSVAGWTQDSERDALDLALELEALGVRRFIITDIATDGMLQGPNLAMLSQFAAKLNSKIIASGGVATTDDLIAIKNIGEGIEGIIVGKAIYEGRFTVSQAIAWVR